ncbi:MAG: M23 family metallopeptidase [Candidatus Moranbacteria bacterium]|nr:M23 family metallopeptidase [Candidatus Moranbacteria bacterium]
MYTRYGHVNQVFVKVGDHVKVGQKIATNGTGNGQWAAHCHRDHPVKIPKKSDGSLNFEFYCIGWTKDEVMDGFIYPGNYPFALGKGYDHAGLTYLQYWDYGSNSAKSVSQGATKPCYHPGLDENGKGSGNDDYDDPVYCVAEGIVRHVDNDGTKNGGWGHLIVVEEIKEKPLEQATITGTLTTILPESPEAPVESPESVEPEKPTTDITEAPSNQNTACNAEGCTIQRPVGAVDVLAIISGIVSWAVSIINSFFKK